MALSDEGDIPLIGMVTRLTSQKGLDLFYPILDELSSLPAQFIILGTGSEEYENLVRGWEASRHDKVRGVVMFSSEMASKIYAGADIFLMPSKSEPCGLSQLIAMRYGTIPVVHTVGGLKDTVKAYNPETKEGWGVTFQSYDSYDFLDAVKRAIELYNDKNHRKNLRKNAMSVDVSWDNASEEYISLYKELTKGDN